MDGLWFGWLVDLHPAADALVRATVLLAAAWLIHFLIRGRNPRWRVLLWRGVAVSVVLVPVVGFVIPRISVPVVPVVNPGYVAEEHGGMPVYLEAPSVDLATPNRGFEAGDAVFGSASTGGSSAGGTVVEAGGTPRKAVARYSGRKSFRTGWAGLLGLVWGTGVFLLSCLCARRSARFRRVLKRSRPVPEAARDLLAGILSELGCGRKVALRSSHDIPCPVLVGVFRSVIVLPERMLGGEYAEDLPAILVHELSHLRSRDLGWSHFIRTVSILGWFHPLAWGMRGAHASGCEEVSDGVTALYIGDAEAYSGTLARVALEIRNRRPVVAGIPMARKAEIRVRLARLRRKIFASPLSRWRVAAFALSGCLVLGFLGALQFAHAENEEVPDMSETAASTDRETVEDRADEGQILFRLVDKETGKGMAGVDLIARYYTMGEEGHGVPVDKYTVTTGVDGSCVIPFAPEALFSFWVKVAHEDYVPRIASWLSQAGDLKVPGEYTMQMERGITIGGRVEDGDGKPLEGVEVGLHLRSPKGPERDHTDVDDVRVTTDSDGTWHYNAAPPNFTVTFLEFQHPDFLVVRYPETNEQAARAPEKLRSRNLVVRMKCGLTLEGVVVDMDGSPVPGAVVARGGGEFPLERPDKLGDWFPVTRRTGGEGRFRFDDAAGAETLVYVEAKGYAPAAELVSVSPEAEPVTIRLATGHHIRVRVTDSHGSPIEGAEVTPSEWRDQDIRLIPRDYNSKTDAEGRVEWNGAPADPVEYWINATGYRGEHVAVTADGDEHTVVLGNHPVASGTVVDTETGELIERFRYGYGCRGKDDRYHRGLPFTVRDDGHDGRYRVEFRVYADGPQEFFVRIEADGYVPATSRAIAEDEGEVACDFELERFPRRVLSPDGRPVEGAQMSTSGPMVRNGQWMFTKMGRLYELVFESGPGGYFEPILPEREFMLVVIHDLGFAMIHERDLGGRPDVTLQPWGRVEGTVSLGEDSIQDATAHLRYHLPYRTGEILVYRDNVTEIDGEGRFTIEYAFPGKARIEIGNRRRNVIIDSGKASRVNMSGPGCTVSGRIMTGDRADVIDWDRSRGYLAVDQPPFPKPENWDGMSDEEKGEYYRDWEEGPEGRANYEMWQSFRFSVCEDGSFRVANVAPGDYDLDFSPYRKDEKRERAGRLSQRVSVTEEDARRGVLDLGDLPLKFRKILEIGQPVPAFEVKDIEGETIRLSDFRGKYVLVDFWATLCGPCILEMPEMKKTYEQFGGEKGLVVVGLSMDEKAEDVREFVEEEGLGWVQGLLGGWETDVRTNYGVDGIPAVFLIGPEGELVAKNIHGRKIYEAVESALGGKEGEGGR